MCSHNGRYVYEMARGSPVDGTAKTVGEALYHYVIVRHGCPRAVLTQGTAIYECGVTLPTDAFGNTTTAYHPQTNSNAERIHRYLKALLRIYVDWDQTNWDECIDHILFAYRTQPLDGYGFSPFFLSYGREPVLPTEVLLGEDAIVEQHMDDFSVDLLQTLRATYKKFTDRQDDQRERQKLNYDKRHQHVEYELGMLVLIWQPGRRKGVSGKLLSKWKGPFTVTKQLSPVNYEVRSMDGRKRS